MPYQRTQKYSGKVLIPHHDDKFTFDNLYALHVIINHCAVSHGVKLVELGINLELLW